jgi:hypothetical protein
MKNKEILEEIFKEIQSLKKIINENQFSDDLALNNSKKLNSTLNILKELKFDLNSQLSMEQNKENKVYEFNF